MSSTQPPRQSVHFTSPVRAANTPNSTATIIPSSRRAPRPQPATPSDDAGSPATESQALESSERLIQQNELLANIQNSLQHWNAQQNSQLSQFREFAIQLGVQIARKLAGDAITADSKHLISKLNDLLGRIDASDKVSLRLNPVDADRFQALCDASTFSPIQVIVVPDRQVELGNCLVESGDEIYVSDWKHQLAEIEKALHQTPLSEFETTHATAAPEPDRC